MFWCVLAGVLRTELWPVLKKHVPHQPSYVWSWTQTKRWAHILLSVLAMIIVIKVNCFVVACRIKHVSSVNDQIFLVCVFRLKWLCLVSKFESHPQLSEGAGLLRLRGRCCWWPLWSTAWCSRFHICDLIYCRMSLWTCSYNKVGTFLDF